MLSTIDQSNLRLHMTTAITTAEPDPARWLIAVRGICERARLDPTRCIPLGETLEIVAFRVIDEASKQQRTMAEMLAALPTL